MKYLQEFDVAESVENVWAFFEHPARVAECIPGVDKVDVLDNDNLSVRVTQRVGPMAATFDAKVHITERVREERIQFTSTGKAVRGAAGHFRATNSVLLKPVGNQTHVVVEGEAALAGALGSVGQKIITKQAEKVTAAFANNLERALSGETAVDPSATPDRRQSAAKGAREEGMPGSVMAGRPVVVGPASDRWAKIAAAFSGTAVILGLIILWRCGAHG